MQIKINITLMVLLMINTGYYLKLNKFLNKYFHKQDVDFDQVLKRARSKNNITGCVKSCKY